MCQYLDTFHTYTECRLRNEDTSGEPQRFAAFLRIVTTFVLGNNQEPDYHRVKERNIFQCPHAVRDPALQDRPASERVCANPMPVKKEEVDHHVESVGYTREIGHCPVCQAAERAIEEALNRNVVVSMAPPGPKKANP
jgi:hypothetical protein